MLVPVSWLKRYVDTKLSAREIADALTMIGLEVEGLERRGPAFDGVVTARVEACEKHPNADKLSLCRVNDGTQSYQVVCGAPNVKAGITIAFAKVGANLPGDFKIKRSKIRGVESEGMICSAKELEIGVDSDGIMHLDSALPLSVPLDEALNLADWVMEVNVTANRPDCLSMLGIARELAAKIGVKVNPQSPATRTIADTVPGVEVEVSAPEGCPRYSARRASGVKVGPSPEWMRSALEAAGVRPINNVVDITNWVMLETGHPMHAFDARRIQDGKIVVRWANEGEELMTLDGVTHKLQPQDLLIADPSKPLALGGIMGGEHTGIADDTTTVILEAAYFDPVTIRKTSKRLRIHSESSHRFERGADPEATVDALDRASQLLRELAGATTIDCARDVYPKKIEKRVILVRTMKIARTLDNAVDRNKMEELLKSVGFTIDEHNESNLYYDPEKFELKVPTNRPDVTCEADVTEEIARLYGFDKLPVHPAAMPATPVTIDPLVKILSETRTVMIGAGLTETVSLSFTDRGTTMLDQTTPDHAVALSNPLKDEEKWLRTSVADSLLKTLAYNVNHQNPVADLFELGRVFWHGEGGGFAQEYRLGVLMAGAQIGHWLGAERALTFYTIKGLVEVLMRELRLDWKLEPGAAPAPSDSQSYHPARSARIVVDGQPVGVFGEVHPAVLAAAKITGPAVLAEIAIERLLAARPKPREAKPVMAFPKAERDIALIVPNTVTYAVLKRAVDETGGKLLEESRLFDVFQGGSIEAGKRSLAISLAFRLPERTLTDAEVDKSVSRIVQRLEKEFGAQLRG